MATMVEVRPVERTKWHGKKGKESFAQPKVIEALYDTEAGRYATGLTAEEAKEYGEKIGADLNPFLSPTESHPFYGSKAGGVKLENNTMFFDIEKPHDYIRVKLMKASKFVANSVAELQANKWPDATHVIYDEQEEVDMKASKVEKIEEATILASKMTDDDKIAMVQILSNKSIKGRTGNFIRVEINELVNAKPDEFIKLASRGKEEVHLRSSVLSLIQKGVLTKEGESIFYMGEMIGIDYERAVEWFKNPHNTKMKMAILEKMQ